MKSAIKLLSITVASIAIYSIWCCCDKKPVTQGDERKPSLTYDKQFNETTKAFNLIPHVEGTDGAMLSFELLYRDSILTQNEDGFFYNVEPFEEGYNVRLVAQWNDTTCFCTVPVTDFILPSEPIVKMTKEELQERINKCDKSITKDEHLTKNLTLIVKDSQMAPQTLSDVIMLISNNSWGSVEVMAIEYNDDDLIYSITLKPINEIIDIDPDEDRDY